MDKYEDQENQRRSGDRSSQNQNRDNDANRDNNQNRSNEYRNETGGNQQQSNRPNPEQLERNWQDMRQSYRQRYPDLTDEDVDYQKGNLDSTMERVARRTGRNRQQVHQDIENWKRDGKNTWD